MLTKKQIEIIECIKTENPKILICAGAKRAGKDIYTGPCISGAYRKISEYGAVFYPGRRDAG